MMRGIICLVSIHIHCFACIPGFKRMIHIPFSSMLKNKMSNSALFKSNLTVRFQVINYEKDRMLPHKTGISCF